MLRPEDCIADSGADLGSCPRLAGAVVGARGYALEPIPRTFGRLLDKIRLKHPEGRVQAFWRGLAQAEGARPALLSASPSARPACRRGGKVVHFL